MQDLTLVGLTEDRKKLVLVSDSGEEYALAADTKLRAALRGDQARLGQLEIEMDSALRPRDIQSRIRSGESPETVAQAAQTTVDKIMTYASPVLAERAHVAERAQRASVRRKAAEGPAKILGDVVAEQLRSKNVDPGAVTWDAWRRGDGRWTVVADYRCGNQPKHAVFTFDVQGRSVVAEDEEARWLVAEPTARSPRGRSTGGSARRLSAVDAEQELPLGDDAIDLVAGDSAGTGPDERTVDLTPAARRLRDAGGAGDADWMATQASDRPAVRSEVTVASPEAAPDDAGTSGGELPARDAGTSGGEPPARDAESHHADEAPPGTADEPPKKSGRKGRRASVPSWDEIMFGGGRSD